MGARVNGSEWGGRGAGGAGMDGEGGWVEGAGRVNGEGAPGQVGSRGMGMRYGWLGRMRRCNG